VRGCGLPAKPIGVSLDDALSDAAPEAAAVAGAVVEEDA
jgi:hypothetical protein